MPASTFEELPVSAMQPPVDGIHLSRELRKPPKVQHGAGACRSWSVAWMIGT